MIWLCIPLNHAVVILEIVTTMTAIWIVTSLQVIHCVDKLRVENVIKLIIYSLNID